MSESTGRKRHFVSQVERFTAARLAEIARKHSSCVGRAVGPTALAQMFRSERLPEDERALEQLASRLTDWALGLSPAEPCPYAPDDLM